MALTSVPRTTSMTEDDMKRVISGISSSRAHEVPSVCITDLSPLIDTTEGRRFLSRQTGEKALILIELFDWALKSYGNPLNLRGYILWTLRQLCASQETLPESCILPIEFKTSAPHHAAGGFADVWKSRYEGRDVAFKTLRSCAKADDATLLRRKRRFCKEVVLWKSLVHPNVLELVGVCRWDGTPDARLTMVSEWMPNGNIIEYIKCNESYRMQLLADSARGVKYLHRVNLVHGDLKGANILITSHNPVRACLADFGFMTIVYDDADGMEGTSAHGGGTTPFMAPELLCPSKFGRPKCQVSKGADVYAFGISVLQVLTGLMPFHPLRDTEIAYKVVQGERPTMPTNAKDLGISDKLWELLARCWHTDPTQRPSIDEVFQHLYDDPARGLIFPPSLIPPAPGCESFVSNTQKYADMFITASMQTPIEEFPPFSLPTSPTDSPEYSDNEIGGPASLLSSAQTQNISPVTSPGNSQIRTGGPKPPGSETSSLSVSNTNDPTTIVTDPTEVPDDPGRAQGQGRITNPLHPAHFPSQHDPIIYVTPHADLTQTPAQGAPRPPPRSDPSGIKPRLQIMTSAPMELRNSNSPTTAFYTPGGSGEVLDGKPFDSAAPVRVIYSRSVSRSTDAAHPFRGVVGVHQQWNSMHRFPTQPTPVSPGDSKTTDIPPIHERRMPLALARPPKINAGPLSRISGLNTSTIPDHEPEPRRRSRLAIPGERRDVRTSKEATTFLQQNGQREMPARDGGEGKEGDDSSHTSTSTGYGSVLGEGVDHPRDRASTPPSSSNSSLFQQLLTKIGVRKHPQSVDTPADGSDRNRGRKLSRLQSFLDLRSGSAGAKRKGSRREKR